MMRKNKTIILTCIMLFISIIANATNKTTENYDWSHVMNAIIKVESGGNPKAHNLVGDCLGVLQIRPLLVRDVNEYLKMKGKTKRFNLRDRLNIEKSKEMFILYQERYNPTNNVEKAIRIWNGGPRYSTTKTNGYFKKVMRYME